MIGITTEYKLAGLLQALSNGEKDLEISRQVLAERSAFEPYTTFKRITRRPYANLSVFQVIEFLKENDFYVLEKDVRNVFRLYSTSADGRLSYTDFLELVLPRTSSVLREVATQRAGYYVAEDEILPFEVEHSLAKIFEKEINLSRKVELLKEDLVSRFDFNLRAVYEVIAEEGQGRADFDAFYNFLIKNNITVIEKDVLAVLRRIDSDKDGRVSFTEFSEAILPVDDYYRRLGETSVRAKPNLRTATPSRTRVAASTSQTKFYSPVSKRPTNADYFDYLEETAVQSSIRRSLSPKRTASPTREIVTASSPSRKLSSSIYNTPTRKSVASPLRGRSPSRLEASSPMKGNEEEQLAKALIEQVELDKELEAAKNKLALQDDFNMFDAFRFFDLTENGFITRLELREGLNDFDVFPSTNEMFLIMKKYNKTENGLLKYTEFCEMLKPKDAGYARLLSDRKPSYVDREELGDVFTGYTIELFKRVLTKVVENEFHTEKVRQRLSRRPLFDNYEAFEALDKSGIGFISKDEFKELLAEHGFFATQKELQSLLNRYDKNEDGKVTYTEFIREITPKSPEKI